MLIFFSLLLLPKLLILLAVFLALALITRGIGIYQKLIIYALLMLAVAFALSNI